MRRVIPGTSADATSHLLTYWIALSGYRNGGGARALDQGGRLADAEPAWRPSGVGPSNTYAGWNAEPDQRGQGPQTQCSPLRHDLTDAAFTLMRTSTTTTPSSDPTRRGQVLLTPWRPAVGRLVRAYLTVAVAGVLALSCSGPDSAASNHPTGMHTSATAAVPSNLQVCIHHVLYWGRRILLEGDVQDGGDYQHMGMSSTEYDALRASLIAARHVRQKAGPALAQRELAKRAPSECARRYSGKTPRPVWQ